MSRAIDPGIFKAKPSRAEAKGDATTRVVRDINHSEEAARIAKTERLRAARLALEITAPAAPVVQNARSKPASRKPAAARSRQR